MPSDEAVAAVIPQPPRGRNPDAVSLSVRADGDHKRLVLWLALPQRVAWSVGWGAGTALGCDGLLDGRCASARRKGGRILRRPRCRCHVRWRALLGDGERAGRAAE